MARVRDPNIITRTLRVLFCTDHAEGVSLFCEAHQLRGWIIGRGSWEDRPGNYCGGRLIYAIIPGVVGTIGKSKGQEWSDRYPSYVPPILSDLDEILRSRRPDEFLARFYRKHGREGFPPLASHVH